MPTPPPHPQCKWKTSFKCITSPPSVHFPTILEANECKPSSQAHFQISSGQRLKSPTKTKCWKFAIKRFVKLETSGCLVLVLRLRAICSTNQPTPPQRRMRLSYTLHDQVCGDLWVAVAAFQYACKLLHYPHEFLWKYAIVHSTIHPFVLSHNFRCLRMLFLWLKCLESSSRVNFMPGGVLCYCDGKMRVSLELFGFMKLCARKSATWP